MNINIYDNFIKKIELIEYKLNSLEVRNKIFDIEFTNEMNSILKSIIDKNTKVLSLNLSDNDEDEDYISDNEESLFEEDNKENNDYIKEDYEPIYTLSRKILLYNNKKIQKKRAMFYFLLRDNFTMEEKMIIHSIYNFDSKNLFEREKAFQLYVLLNIILENFSIILTNSISSYMFSEIPFKKNSKEYKKLYDTLINSFDFSIYLKNNKAINYNSLINGEWKKDIINKEFEFYSNGLVFFIKNFIILKNNFNKVTKYGKKINYDFNINQQNIFQKKLIDDNDNSFCRNEILICLSKWFQNKIKNIMFHSLLLFYKGESRLKLNFRNTRELQIQCIINMIVQLIIIYHEQNKKYNIKKIKKFLFYNIDNRIQSIIEDKLFYITLKYIFENELKKIPFSEKNMIKLFFF